MGSFWSSEPGDERTASSPSAVQSPQSETCEILVLVASDHRAVFCSNCNGVSRFIRAITCGCQTGPDGPVPERVGRSSSVTKLFTRDLVALLEKDIDGGKYEGIIILADLSIHDELRRSRAGKLPHVLVAHLLDSPVRYPAFPSGTNIGPRSVQ